MVLFDPWKKSRVFNPFLRDYRAVVEPLKGSATLSDPPLSCDEFAGCPLGLFFYFTVTVSYAKSLHFTTNLFTHSWYNAAADSGGGPWWPGMAPAIPCFFPW